MKKSIFTIVAIVLVLLVAVFAVQATTGGAMLSFFFGGGTGEWMTQKASFGSCCVEHLFQAIPIIGELAYIGSIVDNINDEQNQRINVFFTTINLN